MSTEVRGQTVQYKACIAQSKNEKKKKKKIESLYLAGKY